MISTSGVPRRVSRRVVLLTKIKRTTMRLGSTTVAFFRRGEELEATGYENLPPDDPTLVPPKLGFRNFDRVPRNRVPLLLASLFFLAAAVTVLGWRSVRRLPGQAVQAATSLRDPASSEWGRLKTAVRATPGAR